MENKVVSIKDSALAFIFGYVVCQLGSFVFVLLALMICQIFKINVNDFQLFLNTSYGYLLSTIVFNSCLIGVFAFFNKKKQNPIIQKPKASKIVLYVLIAVTAFFALSPIISCVDTLIAKMGIPLNEISYTLNTPNLFISFISLAIIPAICEELLFRGLIFKGLKMGGKAFSIIISAIMFSLFHCAIEQTVYPILIGLLLSVIMYYENNILYCIIVHLTNNVMSLLFSYFNISLVYKHWSYILLAVVLCVIYLAIVLLLTFKGNKNTKLAIEKQDRSYLTTTLIIMLILWLIVNLSR